MTARLPEVSPLLDGMSSYFLLLEVEVMDISGGTRSGILGLDLKSYFQHLGVYTTNNLKI